MEKKVYLKGATIRVFESEDLKGLTGDNGETFCVFVSVHSNPLNSFWKWAGSMQVAEHIMKDWIESLKPI